jgi:hypothetical protein
VDVDAVLARTGWEDRWLFAKTYIDLVARSAAGEVVAK